jgi:integrase
VLRRRILGKMRNLTIGHYPALGLAAARQKARAALEDAEAGVDPVRRLPRPRARDGVPDAAFAFWWEQYLDRHVRGRLRSTKNIEGLGKRHILPTFGSRPVTSITRADISRLMEKVAYSKPDRPRLREARYIRQTLSAFYNWALPMLDEMPANPATHALRIPVGPPRERVLSDKEIRAFWKATGHMGTPFGPAFRLLLLTATRRSEVLEARWSELQRDVWTIPTHRVKNKSPHILPLPKAVLKILDSLPREPGSDLWFPSATQFGRRADGSLEERGSSGVTKAVNRMQKLMTDDIGPFPRFTLHDLRRTAATRMQGLGLPLPVAEAVLNHVAGSRGGIIGVYQRHAYFEEKRQGLQLWAAELDRLVGRRRAGAGALQQADDESDDSANQLVLDFA